MPAPASGTGLVWLRPTLVYRCCLLHPGQAFVQYAGRLDGGRVRSKNQQPASYTTNCPTASPIRLFLGRRRLFACLESNRCRHLFGLELCRFGHNNRLYPLDWRAPFAGAGFLRAYGQTAPHVCLTMGSMLAALFTAVTTTTTATGPAMVMTTTLAIICLGSVATCVRRTLKIARLMEAQNA